MKKVDLSIIIVNWKVRPLLEKCLDSIIANQGDYNLEIFVVDNDSRDGTPEMLMSQYPQIKMIALVSNHGFAKANNLGIKQSSGELVFLLNPDTEITAGFFDQVLTYMDSHKDAGILAPKILNSDGSLQNSIRRSPTLFSQILVLLKLKKVLLENRILDHYLAKDFDYNKEQFAEQVMGAAMIIRREVFDKIGLLDENYFIWFEEVDFCYQAKKEGIPIIFFPGATIMHHEGASFSKKRMIKKQLIFNRSLLYYFWKNKPSWQWFIILLFLPINILLTIMYVAFFSEKKL